MRARDPARASDAARGPRWKRCILHADMDAFFAAIEVLDRPELAGKPVIVGGTLEGHGVVSTASYEARRFGVRSAMPIATAMKLCRQGVFLRPRSERYEEVSRIVRAVFDEFTPVVEQISIDEAYLDVTGCPAPKSACRCAEEAIARRLQARIEEATGGLTASIGVAENKFLAKVASDLEKPRGLVIIAPGRGAEFLAPLPVERLWGVGPKSSARLGALGLETIGQVARLEEAELSRLLGKDLGAHLWRLARGIDDRPVVTEWESKSVSHETTFAEFLPAEDSGAVERELFALSDEVAFRLRKEGLWGRTVHLKVRDHEFRTLTRSLTLEAPTQFVEEIFDAALQLWRSRVSLGRRRIRLLGVGATNLVREPQWQLDLLEDRSSEAEAARRRAEVTDAIRERLGEGAITRARLIEGRGRKPTKRRARRR